ncbi:hypothetical protein [Novosphingobium sp. KN65.2]|uniref:hypothetical protein n=1 Tax=Novosphingobium sp. KN65.2 TaxID=1478134 RepID=UPI0012E2E17F|nr:hypothetical protein [Novosphingobium sp. KN65.2]
MRFRRAMEVRESDQGMPGRVKPAQATTAWVSWCAVSAARSLPIWSPGARARRLIGQRRDAGKPRVEALVGEHVSLAGQRGDEQVAQRPQRGGGGRAQRATEPAEREQGLGVEVARRGIGKGGFGGCLDDLCCEKGGKSRLPDRCIANRR